MADLESHATTSTELVAPHLSGSHLVKAFNTMSAEHLRDYAHREGAEMLHGTRVPADDD